MAFNLEARETAWSNRGDIFGGGEVVSHSVDDEFLQCTNELLTAHKSLTKLWWNIRSLEEYLKVSIIPRGLRIQIFPAWEVDPNFKKLWETGLTQCSRILINLLLEHDRDLVDKTKIQITNLELKLSKFDPGTQIDPFQKRLKESLDKFEKDIIEGKKKKFSRDKGDYEKQSAYRWRHSGNRRGRNVPNKTSTVPTASDHRDSIPSDDFLGGTSSDTEESRDEGEGTTRGRRQQVRTLRSPKPRRRKK